MGLSDNTSEINGNFGRKSQIFPTYVHNAVRVRSPWNFVTALVLRNSFMPLPDDGKSSVTICAFI